MTTALDWRDWKGQRRRQASRADNCVAERMRGELISQRDPRLVGPGSQEGPLRPFGEIRDLHFADVAQRAGRKQSRTLQSTFAES
jgi:hypothetical protein